MSQPNSTQVGSDKVISHHPTTTPPNWGDRTRTMLFQFCCQAWFLNDIWVGYELNKEGPSIDNQPDNWRQSGLYKVILCLAVGHTLQMCLRTNNEII